MTKPKPRSGKFGSLVFSDYSLPENVYVLVCELGHLTLLERCVIIRELVLELLFTRREHIVRTERKTTVYRGARRVYPSTCPIGFH